MTKLLINETFGSLRLTPDQAAKEYALGYEAGKKAGAKVAVGQLFRGAFGFADIYAGSNRACRETPAWKGACAGYLDGLSVHSVMVDGNGIVREVR
jgi:hypothetical protein